MFGQNPLRVHLAITLTLCSAGTVAGWWFLAGHENHWKYWLANWLLAVNLVSFVYYGMDKLLATREMWRVPELVLHTLSAIGGSPAALLAMWLFRHKTIKTSFRILFWSIVVLQTVLVAYIVKAVWWP